MVFGSSGKIFDMIVERYRNDIEGEAVALHPNCNRELTPRDANWAGDRPHRSSALILDKNPFTTKSTKAEKRSGPVNAEEMFFLRALRGEKWGGRIYVSR